MPLEHPTLSGGNLPTSAPIPGPQPIKCNLKASLLHPIMTSFGNLEHLLSANLLLGWSCKIEWWMELVMSIGRVRKAMVSMIMLVSWEIWKERNARVFQQHVLSSLARSKRRLQFGVWPGSMKMAKKKYLVSEKKIVKHCFTKSCFAHVNCVVRFLFVNFGFLLKM
jgi:hypothetical protein